MSAKNSAVKTPTGLQAKPPVHSQHRSQILTAPSPSQKMKQFSSGQGINQNSSQNYVDVTTTSSISSCKSNGNTGRGVMSIRKDQQSVQQQSKRSLMQSEGSQRPQTDIQNAISTPLSPAQQIPISANGSNKKQGISSSLHITTAENPNGIAPEVGEIHLPTLNPTKNMQKANIINSSTLKSSN